MTGALILVALQVMAAGSHNGGGIHYGWQPIGTFTTEPACISASRRLIEASSFKDASSLSPAVKSASAVKYLCLGTGGGNG